MDNMEFMGKEVVTSEHIPEGTVFLFDKDKIAACTADIEKLSNEIMKMGNTITTDHTLQNFQEAIAKQTAEMTTEDYYAAWDSHNAWANPTVGGKLGTTSTTTSPNTGTWNVPGGGSGTWHITDQSTKDALYHGGTPAQYPLVARRCALCDSETENMSLLGDVHCDLCIAAIAKVREDLFTDQEAVYIHDINKLMEET